MFDIVFLKNFAHLNNYPRTRWSWDKNLIDYESVIILKFIWQILCIYF